MKVDKLTKANEYIERNSVLEEELPVFHVTPPCGWMNDPNGFSVFDNRIHLFYQFHPYSEVWGPMYWGHLESDDMIKWRRLPVALAPDMPFDEAGCFSGSAIQTEEGHMIFYTGVIEKDEDGQRVMYQNQCLAIGDGKTYAKYEDNPIVTGDMLPDNANKREFRDPKVWKEEDGYYMIAGNKTIDDMPQIVMFYSKNLREWKYVSILAADNDRKLGSMWECPDFFKIDDRYVLIASHQDMIEKGELHNGNNSDYYLGTYNKVKHTFDYDEVYSLDDGLDFYAPQTMLMPDGRRIMIGWMQSWDVNIRPQNQKWACMMALPRELSLKDGRIIQRPVREIEKYHKNKVSYEGVQIEGKCVLGGICGRVIDMTVEILEGDYREFSVLFAQNDTYNTMFTYYKEKNILEIDRTYCGMNRDVLASRKVKNKTNRYDLKLRFIMDKYSAEIFVGEGEQVLSSTFYTPLDADGISFVCDGKLIANIYKFDI